MQESIRQLLGLCQQDQSRLREVLPVLKAILYSDALTEAVRSTKSPVDDLVLRVLRALIPQE